MTNKFFKKEFGEINFEGERYYLQDSAELTSRNLEAQFDRFSQGDNNKYFEMSATALNNKGDKFTVFWIFEEKHYDDCKIKHKDQFFCECGVPLDNYDYDNVDRVRQY
jgi:hypothetical protein